MPSGWNDRVSSAIGYASCDTYLHYQHSDYGGSSITCICASMGTMNDATSSELWLD